MFAELIRSDIDCQWVAWRLQGIIVFNPGVRIKAETKPEKPIFQITLSFASIDNNMLQRQATCNFLHLNLSQQSLITVFLN